MTTLILPRESNWSMCLKFCRAGRMSSDNRENGEQRNKRDVSALA